VRDSNGNRLVACRACGNRVPREARRCPACGRREPTAPEAERPSAPRPDPPRRRPVRALTFGLLLALVVAGATAVYFTTPARVPRVSGRPSPPPVVPPAAPSAPSAPSAPVTASKPAPAATERSHSRGRSDWLFFFRPGDWLTRMTDDVLLGVVIRVEKSHAFADGTTGPAYVMQSMDGEERVVDADELERTARLR